MCRSSKIDLFVLTALISLCFFPFAASANVIRTDIFCQYTVEKPGKISLDTVLSNTGDATAYNIVATLFVAGWAQKFDDLPNNPPGGKIPFSARYRDPKLKPGKYAAVMRINFEELSGRPHRAYHVFRIPYLLNKTAVPHDTRLFVQIDPPLLQNKPFWKKRGHMKLSLTNRHSEPISVQSTVYLPDGFTGVEPDRFYKLSPGETKSDKISVISNRFTGTTGTFHFVAWYELGGIHHSSHMEGEVRVEDNAVYFGWYLFLAMTILAFLLGAMIYQARRK